MDTKAFGRIVKQFRTNKKMTQRELADTVGYKEENYISKIESGLYHVGSDKLLKIMDALDISFSNSHANDDSISKVKSKLFKLSANELDTLNRMIDVVFFDQ
jgi:transcriptional regulator with XRE-family HTH domain